LLNGVLRTLKTTPEADNRAADFEMASFRRFEIGGHQAERGSSPAISMDNRWCIELEREILLSV